MEMFSLLKEFIKPELIVVIPVLYLIGVGIKKSECLDKYIPMLLGAIGIILATLYTVATTDLDTSKDIILCIFTAITQGILLAGASVYANQLYKQNKKTE